MTWKAFGAIPAPMPYSELYSTLQAGVIDGAENEPVSVLINKFHETCPYFSITEHLILPMGLFMSAGVLDGSDWCRLECCFLQAGQPGRDPG